MTALRAATERVADSGRYDPLYAVHINDQSKHGIHAAEGERASDARTENSCELPSGGVQR